MNTNPGPPASGRRWTWLLLVAIVLAVGRLAWSVSHHAPPPAPQATAPAALVEGPMAWTPPADAERQSLAAHKPILYEFNAAWCGPCQELRREVLSDETKARAISAQVVPVSVVDRQREDGHNPPDVEALQERFKIEAFPTLVVLSPATGKFEKYEGYAGAQETVDWIAHSVASVR